MIGKNPAEHAEFVESPTVETPELIESNTPRNSSPPANLGGLTWIAWHVQPSTSANQVRDPESGRRGVARPRCLVSPLRVALPMASSRAWVERPAQFPPSRQARRLGFISISSVGSDDLG
jgi:hypothetical protein